MSDSNPPAVGLTPAQAAEMLECSASYAWALLSKVCPATGEPELLSPMNQPPVRKGSRVAGRLITTASVEDYKGRHRRTADSWVHIKSTPKTSVVGSTATPQAPTEPARQAQLRRLQGQIEEGAELQSQVSTLLKRIKSNERRIRKTLQSLNPEV